MTREEKRKVIDALKISTPVIPVTLKGYNTYIQTLSQAMDWLEQQPCEDAVSKQTVKEQMIKYGFHAPDMTVTEFIEDLSPVNLQESCEDCISRQAVNALVDELARAISDERRCVSRGRSATTIMRDILHLPSVTPQPKSGKWIPLEYDGYADGNPVWDKWECSKCGWEHNGDEESLTAFCSNCGAKMIEP